MELDTERRANCQNHKIVDMVRHVFPSLYLCLWAKALGEDISEGFLIVLYNISNALGVQRADARRSRLNLTALGYCLEYLPYF